MQVTMRYGREGLPLELPDDCRVELIHKKSMPVEPDPEAAVRAAVQSPVGCGTLREEARGKASACILICDITRPVPNGLLLPVIIRELMEAGMAGESITVLVATGLHRPNLGDELRELVGDDRVMNHVRVENHFARNDEDHVELGRTGRGTVVKLDRRFVQADLRIATGLVEPHFMAGYSGGRKVIMPGVAHQDTVRRIHSASFMEDPGAVNCRVAGNPLHEEQIEVVDMLGGALCFNTVITEHRELSFVNFGEIHESHLQAVAFVRPYAEAYLDGTFGTVLTSSAGYPLDRTYYQTVKGMVGAVEILEPGGDIFIVSEIGEGFGSADYVEAQKRLVELGIDGFLRDIEPKWMADVDEWQTEEQLKPMRKGTVHLYTQGLSREEAKLTGVEVIGDLDALQRAIAASARKGGRLAVIPEGPYVLPFVRGRR